MLTGQFKLITILKEVGMKSAEQWKEEGNQRHKQGKFAEALHYYQQCVAVDSKLKEGWYNQGLMNKKLHQEEAAILAFTKALALDPQYQKACYNLAECLRSLQKYDEALKHFKILLQQTPTHEEAQLGAFLCKQQIAAKVIFSIVDLKLTDDNEIKILEFGQGMSSGFSGLKIATNEDVLSLLVEQANKPNLPSLLVNNIPADQDILANEPSVQQNLRDNLPAPLGEFNLKKLASYRAMYAGMLLAPCDERVLLMDDINLNFAFQHKGLSHEGFEESKKLAARPHTLRFSRHYLPTLADTIKEQMPNVKQFVLKVPELTGGKGVIIATDNELDSILSVLLAPENEEVIAQVTYNYICSIANQFTPAELKAKAQSKLLSFVDWKHSQSEYFMVEEYVKNKPVHYKDKPYDATMRVAFLLVRDEEKVTCEPFAYYWKLPPQPITHVGELRDKTVSSFSATHRAAVAVSQADKEVVATQIREVLPSVLTSIMHRNIPAYIDAYPENDETCKRYKTYLYLHFSNSFTRHGQYSLAEYFLKKANQLVLEDYLVYHEWGVHHFFRGNYDEAISNLNNAIELNPGNGSSYFRRGMVYLAQLETEAAKINFDKAIQLQPSYQKRIERLWQNYNQSSPAPLIPTPFVEHRKLAKDKAKAF